MGPPTLFVFSIGCYRDEGSAKDSLGTAPGVFSFSHTM